MAEPGTATVTPAAVSDGRVARSFSVQLLCRGAGMVASVTSVAMTARYLGPDRYGQLTTAVVFIGLWTSLTNLGIGTVIVRRVTSGRGDLQRLTAVNSGLSLVYCLPLAVAAAGTGWLLYDDTDVRAMLAVLASSLVMATMTSRFEPVFMVTVRFTAVAVSDLVSRVGTLAAVAWFVHSGAGLVWFAVAQLVPPAVQLVVQGVAASRHISLRPVFAPREAAGLLRESLAQLGVIVIAVLYWRADGVILSLLSNPAEVGVYGLALTIAFNTEVLSTFFLKSTLSTATELYARDGAAFAAFLRRSVETMYLLAIPVAVVGAALAEPLIAWLGDADFVDRGAPALALLFVAIALRFVTGTLGQGLFAAHHQRFLLRLSVATLALNVTLNLALVGRFGALGAGTALICTELFGMAIASTRLHRVCGYRPPAGYALRVLVPAAAAAAAAVLLAHQHVLVSAGAAVAVFAATTLAVGPIRLSTVTAAVRGRASRRQEADHAP
ncbi:flippase [Mycobacterium sp. MYCO198283]|uniref:flippase n=1 Tax=Mycobacterium sp. MYCO198283 TaxID=2883505 RepID=UPI001E3F4CEE|nr:flippase [Mycobacterium sp. MYCO198283]MCG5433891.1 flippase [Mycobacterium sp. MYCO198283]